MNTTTNSTLCQQLATKYELPVATAQQLITEYWQLITLALTTHHRVHLPPNVGTLYVHFYREKRINVVVDNPRAPTALIETPHHRRKLVFTPSHKLRQQIQAMAPERE